MNTTISLANRIREVILNGTWIANTNFKQELDNVNWQTASTKVDDFNTIAALAQHIHYYIKGVKEALITGELKISDRYSFDFPEITHHEMWTKFLKEFWNDSEELAHLVAQMSEEKLQQNFVLEKYGSVLRNIDGLIEHSYYHLGQIVLIKKMVLRQSNSL